MFRKIKQWFQKLTQPQIIAFEPKKKGTTEIKPLIEEYLKQHPLKPEDYPINKWFNTDKDSKK